MYGAIFDMDGVLVDSNETHFLAFQRIGVEIGVPFDRAMLERSFGRHNNQIFPMWLGPDLPPARVTELALRKEAIYRELAAGSLQAVPGAVDLLRALRQAGWRIAIGSSGPGENVRLAIEVLGIAADLDAVVTGDDVAQGKPAPDVFLLAVERLGLPPRRCLVLEDAPNGVRAARAAGVPVLAITTSCPAKDLPADRVVTSFAGLGAADLAAVVEQAGRSVA